jgi:threonylcarbamoyladenosine tRNA methylthiotransferase MtaB
VASFYVQNFGCRATQADGAAIERQFRERGLNRASAPAQAEIVVLNTCTVTAAADQDARAAIRRIHRQNPGCQIVVTGCYAQRAPDEISLMPGVTQVIGNSHKHQVAEIAVSPEIAGFSAIAESEDIARSWEGHGFSRGESDEKTVASAVELPNFAPLTILTSQDQSPIFVSDIFAHTELLAAPVFDAPNERTRPNLKVQDGCDNRCSFCVIPYVRGHSRSSRLARILEEVNALVSAGYREVVISGINLGRWGRDLTPEMWGGDARLPRFEDLIRAILDQTTLEKLRISSVEPMDWSNELIGLLAESSRIAKHAHVPMQSGSDAVLRRMHRKYRPWHYREKIEKIHDAMPTAAIGADVMVGFPGETDAEFDETVRMIESLPFTYLHVFTYSPRPGTPAGAMHYQVPVHVARERNRILRNIDAEKKLAFMQSFIGKTVEAITLHTSNDVLSSEEDGHCPPDYTQSLTDNYLKLRLQGRHDANRWVNARVESVESGMLVGILSNGLDVEERLFSAASGGF